MASPMDLTTTVTCRLQATAVKAGDLVNEQAALNLNYSDSLADGSGTNQADLLWRDTATISSGASTTIDLLGALSGLFGETVNFASVKGIFIRNRTTAGGSNLVVGAAASNPFDSMFSAVGDSLILPAMGTGTSDMWSLVMWAPASGWTVDATNQNLKLTHDASDSNDITVDIVLVGVST